MDSRKRKYSSLSDSDSEDIKERGQIASLGSKLKRTRNEDQEVGFALEKYLAILSKPQLIALITNLTTTHSHISPLIYSLLPRPTNASITTYFQSLEQKLLKSFPYNRNGNGYDDYSYNRVKGILVEIKDAILSFACYFSTSPSDFPHNSFQYLHLATHFAAKLPDWNNTNNNAIKIEVLVRLNEYWKGWVDNVERKSWEGRIWSREMVEEWWRGINEFTQYPPPTFDGVINLFKQRVGWIIGLAPQPSYPSYSTNTSSFSGASRVASPFSSQSQNSSNIPGSPSCSLSWNSTGGLAGIGVGGSGTSGAIGPLTPGGSVTWGMEGMVADGKGRVE